MPSIRLLLFLLIALVLGTNVLLAQSNSQGGWYGGSYYSSTPPGQEDNVSTPGESSEGKNPAENQNNSKVPVTRLEGQTDEYGYFNFNAYCTGFTGVEWIAVPNSPSFYNESFDGSAELWIYPTQFAGTGTTLMSLGATSNKAFGWYVQSTGQFTFRIGSTELVHAGTAVPLNTWTHVAVTWTGGGPYTVTFYVNGAQSGATMNNTGVWNSTLDSLRIGRDQAFTTSAFRGYIDEAKFWADQRILAEVRDNRFVGLGDDFAANTGNALTSGAAYTDLRSSWNFNTGNNPTLEFFNSKNGYMRGALSQVYSPYAPYPMPYNFALSRPAAVVTNYVTVPSNAAFNLTSQGTVEMWYYTTNIAQTQWLINKGSAANITWGLAMASTDRLAIRFGNLPVINTAGVPIPANRWVHIAASWTGTPGNYNVIFYVDGKQSGPVTPVAGTMNVTADPLTLGISIPFNGFGLLGYMDEVRVWNDVRTPGEILQNMYKSGRAMLPDASMMALWNFDGNLINRSATASINGSLSTGGANNCRLSAFLNENTTGALSTAFIAHPTVLNRQLTPDPFAAGFIIKSPTRPIPDLATTRDTIFVPGSATLTSLEVFLSIQHTFCGDLDITLRAPNGTTRDVTSDNGGGGDHILTVLGTTGTNVTTAAFLPPWTNLSQPEVAFGNMGATNIQGNWILEIVDDAGGDVGVLVGWGLRFNGAVTNIEPISGNIPNKFQLYQNYPNPFNPATTVRFDLAKNSDVKIKIYDILGRDVKTLVNEFKNAGTYEVKFDASNIASGTYFYKIEAGDFVDIKKMVLVK
jgi:subtilisin-like proprotein convertase family protein